MAIPTLASNRLLLRAHRMEDFEPFAAMWADAEATRHIGAGEPRGREESWTSFLRNEGQWQMIGFGNWAVVEKGTETYVGVVGFIERMRVREEEDLAGMPEMGWMFATAFAGRGYATEAVREALDWAKGFFRTGRVLAVAAPENTASLRVAEKCGFRELRRGLSLGRPRVFLERALR
jgi:RimJ/RimL family protein N-acetyltransferase